MLPIAVITETDITAWTAIAVSLIAAVGTVAAAVIALVARVVAQTGQVRLDAQHQRLESQQAQLSAVQLATPTTPSSSASPVKVTLNHEALANALKPMIAAAVAEANSPTKKQS